MPSVSIYFSTDDEEAYHQALALVGDKKAVAINNLRSWDGFYDAKLELVVHYVLDYINLCLTEGSKKAYDKHCLRITGINTSTLPRGLWNNIRHIADIPDNMVFTQLALVPFMRSQFGVNND